MRAATSMKSAGKRVVVLTRLMVTSPSSSGCRSTSSVRRLNSGSSSRNNTPLWARLISPGIGIERPPTRPASLMVWWGARKGLVANSGWPGCISPRAL